MIKKCMYANLLAIFMINAIQGLTIKVINKTDDSYAPQKNVTFNIKLSYTGGYKYVLIDKKNQVVMPGEGNALTLFETGFGDNYTLVFEVPSENIYVAKDIKDTTGWVVIKIRQDLGKDLKGHLKASIVSG